MVPIQKEPSSSCAMQLTRSWLRQFGRRQWLVDHEIVAVIAVQSARGAEPDEAAPVREDAGDGVLRQAVLDGDVLEAGLAGKRRQEQPGDQQRQDDNGRTLRRVMASFFTRVHSLQNSSRDYVPFSKKNIPRP